MITTGDKSMNELQAAELIGALKQMIDAFHEDPLSGRTGAAVERAYAAIEDAPQMYLDCPYGDLLAMMVEMNDLCRSSYQIAARIAVEHSNNELGTMFGAFQERLAHSLTRQYNMLRPELERRAMLAAAEASKQERD
jgi:hypothetical protein